jgi:hypothetical protein
MKLGGRNAVGRTVADDAGRCWGVLPGIPDGAGSHRSGNSVGLGAGRDPRVGARGVGGKPLLMEGSKRRKRRSDGEADGIPRQKTRAMAVYLSNKIQEWKHQALINAHR